MEGRRGEGEGCLLPASVPTSAELDEDLLVPPFTSRSGVLYRQCRDVNALRVRKGEGRGGENRERNCTSKITAVASFQDLIRKGKSDRNESAVTLLSPRGWSCGHPGDAIDARARCNTRDAARFQALRCNGNEL